MNKIFGLFLLALAFLAPGSADAASRFAVCTTTCTWDNTSTAMWSATSGGATGASAPVAADDVTLDAATCVGGTTCTITAFAGTISINSLVMSACTASTAGCILDGATNNTSFIVAGPNCYLNSGAGTRTFSLGNSSVYTCSNNSAFFQTVASATMTMNASTLAFTGTGGTGAKRFQGSSKTFGTVTIAGGTSGFDMNGSVTIGTLTISGPNKIGWQGASTYTITTLTNISASLSNPILFTTQGYNAGVSTISSANNFTCDFCGIANLTFSGGGTFAATNSFDYKNNTGVTITPPSGGSGRIIGG